ncbi:chorismate synthase [Actinomyces graevenitzii]|jgi:chorismate synthase|uniref:Chorismate synthase n=1 Tax=Actinomyces graevenitzii C83 TaxID=435830 RepID=G9PE80_9ACTO|nr:chorismate synthase [Actinomyces graevenitzii]EHM89060.1 chorismate synthase [Actinomyces graevenitzii C83]PMC91992.1 chorismate synthase [Actinomyces graevenitzii]
MLTWTTAGESHGPSLVAIVQGVPAGIALTSADIQQALTQRRQGYGRGARQAFERDQLRILSGLRHGVSLGSPIAVEIANSEWPKWEAVMSADPVDAQLLKKDAGTGDEREIARNKRLTKPRPGHADLAGMLKYGHQDARNVLERASARETAARVALGAIATQILRQVAGIELVSQVIRIGTVCAGPNRALPTPSDNEALNSSPVRNLDKALAQRLMAEIDATKRAGDTLGGEVEVLAYNVPVGLGSHVSAQRRLDARLAGALMSIQSVKGVQIGDAYQQAASLGSSAQDEIIGLANGHIERASNHAGGIEGGISNGSVLRVSAALKPISTVPRALRSVDLANGAAATALHQRSDTCAVVPAAVIAQAEVAMVLADALLEKTGGDSLLEAKRNLAGYLEDVAERTNW